MTMLAMIEGIIRSKDNRLSSLYDKLFTTDMGLVFTLLAIHEGKATREQILEARNQHCPKRNLLQCERREWITWTLEQSPHDSRAMRKVYALTEAGHKQAEKWVSVLAPIHRKIQSK